MPQQKPIDDLPDDPITAGPGAPKGAPGQQAAAPGADDLPDDPITGEGKRPASPHDAPFRGKAQLSPEQQAAMERTNKYIQEREAPDLWGNVKEFGTTIGGDIAGLAKTAWELGTEDLNLIPGQAWEMAKGLGKAQLDEFKKAYDAAQKGDWSEAAGYTGAGLLPLLGPAAADIAEDIGSGHYGRAGARLVELAGPELFKFFKVGPAVRKLPIDPKLEAALTETEQAGVETTVGQRMRSPRLQKAEMNLQNFPGSEEQRAAQLQKQRSQLKARGEALAEKQSPTTPKITQSETGGRIQERMAQRVNRFKGAADNAYDDFRRQAALGKKTLQNGWEIERDADGNVIGRKPVMKDFETPVDIRKIQAELRPVWDDLQGPFQQPAQAAASPGFQKFAQLMATNDWYMDAVDFDRTMGAIKSITRDGKNTLLSNRSQGIAKLMIKEGEKALDTAFSKVKATSPTIKASLKRGQRLVRTYYDQAEFARKLGREPSDVYQFLTKTGKGSLEEIKTLRSYAPQELGQVARSYLEGMIEEGSEAGGSFDRMGRMAQVFEKLDGEVQDALFGKTQAAEIKRYLDSARYLNPLEGTPTAGRLAQMLHWGPAWEAISSLTTGVLTGHPLAGLGGAVGGAVGYAGIEYIGPKIAARLLLQPGTPRLLTQVIKLPGNSKIWTRAAQALTVRAMAMEQHVRREEEEQRRAQGQPPAAATPPAAQAGRGSPPTAPFKPYWEGDTLVTGPGGARGIPPPQKPSPLRPRAEASEGQEAAPSEAPTRAPGTAAASGTRPQAVAPQVSQPGTLQPPAGTTWEYWGLKPPAHPGERPQPISPPARTPIRPARAPIAGRPAARAGGRMAQWQPMFRQVGQSMGVPPGLMSAIVQIESRGNPQARGTSGEIGLAQLMPATARALKVDPSDPQQAIRGMATLLRHLMTKYRGNIAKVLAAYNEGETAFDKRLRRGLPLPAITQNYVRKGLALLRAGGQQVQTAAAGGPGSSP